MADSNHNRKMKGFTENPSENLDNKYAEYLIRSRINQNTDYGIQSSFMQFVMTINGIYSSSTSLH